MADDLTDVSEWLCIIAKQRGVTHALVRLPVLLRPALERAARPLPPPPTGATTELACGMALDLFRDEI